MGCFAAYSVKALADDELLWRLLYAMIGSSDGTVVLVA